MRRGVAIIAPFLLAAAAVARGGDAPPGCPPGGTPLRWEGFGLDFLGRHCTPCHDWSHYPSVYRERLDIGDLVGLSAMPPFERVDAAEVAKFEEWIACDLPYDGATCPPGGTSFSYDSFAAGFFADNCTRCHSKDLQEGERNGAPPGFNWDDYASVQTHALDIRDVVLKSKMPPDFPFILPSDVDALVEWISCGEPEHPAGTLFRRADANADGEADLSDTVTVLAYLFRGAKKLDCLDAADVDGNGRLEITDAVRLLRYLFESDPPPPLPFDACGSLPALGCEQFDGCTASEP
jgi:hypothetical protein